MCSLIEDKSRLYQQLSMQNSYFAHKILPSTDDKFGYDWDPNTANVILEVDGAEPEPPTIVEGHEQIFELIEGKAALACYHVND